MDFYLGLILISFVGIYLFLELMLIFGKKNTVFSDFVLVSNAKTKGVKYGDFIASNVAIMIISVVISGLIALLAYLIRELRIGELMLKILGIIASILLLILVLHWIKKGMYILFIKFNPELDPKEIRAKKAKKKNK